MTALERLAARLEDDLKEALRHVAAAALRTSDRIALDKLKSCAEVLNRIGHGVNEARNETIARRQAA